MKQWQGINKTCVRGQINVCGAGISFHGGGKQKTLGQDRQHKWVRIDETRDYFKQMMRFRAHKTRG